VKNVSTATAIIKVKENTMGEKPKLEIVDDENITIAKPSAFSFDKFKSKHGAAAAGVETLLTALPHHNISAAKDFVRLHPNEETHWSPQMCFVNVPIKGQKNDTLHVIEEELAMRYLPSGKITRLRLALASKPFDVFFLCHIPTQNQDNSWNVSNLQACEQAKSMWVQVTSRKEEGIEGYKLDFARHADAFGDPKWPTQSLEQLVDRTFAGRMIDRDDHPALLRLIGARQDVS
jgi:hypothetical protein